MMVRARYHLCTQLLSPLQSSGAVARVAAAAGVDEVGDGVVGDGGGGDYQEVVAWSLRYSTLLRH